MADPTTSVKIDTKVYEKVKRNKKKTKIPIGKYFEMAAMEKLNKENQQPKP